MQPQQQLSCPVEMLQPWPGQLVPTCSPLLLSSRVLGKKHRPRGTLRTCVMLKAASAQPCWSSDQPRLEQDARTSAGRELWMLQIL